MLVIRPEQLSVLAFSLGPMEQHLIAHFARFFPERHRGCGGDEGLRAVLRHGAARAGAYKLFRRAAIADFIATTFYLGCGFAGDPRYPWAARLLSARGSDIGRAREVKLTALSFIERAEGAENEHLNEALRRLRTSPVEDLLPPPEGRQLDAYFVERLQFLHPMKCVAIGEAPLQQFVARILEAAAGHGLHDYRHAAVYVATAFLLGASFDRDPQFPHFARALHDDLGDGQWKGERLHRVARAYLEAELV
ncbi:MAG TPA: hypothetical protein VJ276_13795 [Thermoanaerobaculia bacterium]|nr:hypothetical protein [Thermoanaerobaculia bacterium]